MRAKKIKYLAIPYIMWMIIFILIPLLLIIGFSFSNNDGDFTLHNFTKIVKYFPVFYKSLFLAFWASVISLVLSYPLAYMLSQIAGKKQKFVLMALILPMWMNFLLRTYAWMTILENEGIINKIFRFFNFTEFSMINTQGAVVLGMVYNYLPFMILPLYSIMTKINRDIIEAAQDLGANSFYVLIKIIFPLSVPGIITGWTMVFVPAVSTFIISRMLGGGGNLLIGDLIEQQFLGSVYNPYVGSALSLGLMVIILISLGITNRFGNNQEDNILL